MSTTIEPTNACEMCFGPLEVSYDYDSIAKSISRETIQRGPATMWRYHDFLPVSSRRRGRHRHRLHAAAQGREPGPAARPERAVRQERRGQPDQLVQGPPGHRHDVQGAGVRVRRTGVSVHRQPDGLGGRARRAGRHEDDGVLPGRPGARQDHPGRLLRPYPGGRRRQLRPGEPPLQRARGQQPLGIRQHKHAALLRGGQQDAGPRGRRAARLEGPRPLHSAGRVRRAAYEDMEGARGDGAGRPDRPARRRGCISPRRRDALP